MKNIAKMMEENVTYITPLLEMALKNLENGFKDFIHDNQEQQKLMLLLQDFAGRETPLYEAKNLGKRIMPKYISNVRILSMAVRINLTMLWLNVR